MIEGSCTKVRVSKFVSSAEVWLQNIENTKELSLVEKHLQAAQIQNGACIERLSVGNLCVIFSRTYERYVRAKILLTDDEGKCGSVLLIDYGGEEMKRREDMFHLPKFLFRWSPLAMHCYVVNIDHVSTIDFMMPLTQHESLNCSVVAFHEDGSRSIILTIPEYNPADLDTMEALSWTTSFPVHHIASSGDTPSLRCLVQTLSKSSNPCIQEVPPMIMEKGDGSFDVFHEDKPCSLEEDETVLPLQQSLEEKGSVFRCWVSEYHDTSEFFIVPEWRMHDLNQVEDILRNFEDKDTIDGVVGLLCLAQDNRKFFRVVVLEVNTSDPEIPFYRVQSLDLGYTFDVLELHKLPSSLSQISPISFTCYSDQPDELVVEILASLEDAPFVKVISCEGSSAHIQLLTKVDS